MLLRYRNKHLDRLAPDLWIVDAFALHTPPDPMPLLAQSAGRIAALMPASNAHKCISIMDYRTLPLTAGGAWRRPMMAGDGRTSEISPPSVALQAPSFPIIFLCELRMSQNPTFDQQVAASSRPPPRH